MSHKTKAQKLRQRQSVTIWYPRASDLVLPDVRPSERAEVRQILGSATPEQELLRPPESLSAKEFLDSLAQYEQDAVLSAICYRAGLKI